MTANRVAFPDGTDNFNHGQGLIVRWRPAPGVEIMPFWTLNNDYNDEAGPFYVPAGKFLPPNPPRARVRRAAMGGLPLHRHQQRRAGVLCAGERLAGARRRVPVGVRHQGRVDQFAARRAARRQRGQPADHRRPAQQERVAERRSCG